ncbi:MAG: chromosome segregation protein SMC [Bacteroidetes bacterium]|nr:chromosome segregation protein SMC [Bacteroidota bacterium]
MRLRSLDIKGFKSFADKTQVLLDHPITGIVGPNGCGKSNIVDAIRWVIGEHKIKSLRSDNLEDLIFNGSKTRAGSGMAEVSLTFENTRNLLPTEFTTVTITRKFYKSGESEYRLNDVACRLKDIHNLFLDTGVSNDSYAIIELGMVDDIIKDKEGSRRRMLEQAAGISIYKTRKKEARQKLEATEADLSRIEDLLFEIGANLRTLESQARKAERYFKIKGEYKELSIELAKASLEHFNEQYKSLNEQEHQETDRKAGLEAAVATGEAQIEKDKTALITQEQELNGLQKAFNDLLNRVRQLEADKRLAAQRLEYLREREQTLNQAIAGADRQLGSLEESIAFSSQQISTETSALEGMRSILDNLRKGMDESRNAFDTARQQLDLRRNESQATQRRQFEAEKKVAVADTSVTNLQRNLQHLQGEAASRSTTIDTIRKERAAAEVLFQEKQSALDALLKKQEELKGRILEGQEALEALRATLVEENRRLDSKKNEHDLLKSLVDSLEGYPDSIKFLKRHKDWNHQAPLLSDVFVVKPEFRTALENVLEQYLNYYVVENIEEAAQAIRLLEGAKKGKANFILLDKINEARQTQIQYDNEAIEQLRAASIGPITPALEAVEVEEKYQVLAGHLLRHVLICTQLPEGTKSSEGFVLVDKSGRYKSEQFTVGGGSVGIFEGNKIGRAKNLELLASDIASLSETTTSLRAQITAIQTKLAGFNAELSDKAIEQSRQELNRIQSSISNYGNRIETYEAASQSGERRMQEVQAQLDQTQQSIAGTREELASIVRELQGINEALKTAESAFATVEAQFNTASQEYNTQNIQFTRQQSKLESLKGELQFRNNQRADTLRQRSQSQESLADTSKQLGETETALHAGDEELYQLLSRKESDERALNEKDRSYYEKRNAVSAAESVLSQKRKEKESAEALLAGIKEKLGEMKLSLAGMKERLQVEFRVSLEQILDEPRQSEQGVDELNAESERLKQRLESMGEVNPTAVEAFSEVKARHDFISGQKDDLVKAKESLQATIEEVEATANTRFRETFEQVRENFGHVFKALFTEDDSADLRLTDPDNVAESGIEIYAQPKGKKPSTLTQLSGGEKTLTSTAFLFAIYLIKPAPFCILDEVDAPLDDANVGKFTNMIRKFSDNSQFIIVTHNKQTMASVDVIYGVTMQEPGVSKLVPVDFRSLN